jgi:hypothetical protein
MPWSRLDVEIPFYETDETGSPLPIPGTYLLPAIYRGRLFLFMPQLIATSTHDSTSITNANTFDDLRTKKPSDNMPRSRWTMKMAWSEFRNGKWAKKEVSVSGINIDPALTVGFQH